MMPAAFHFLRPEWLWLMPVITILLFFIVKNFRPQNHWDKVCDTALLHYQLTQEQQKNTGKWQWLSSFSFLLLLFSIVIIALAGPSWEKKEQPVFQQDDALVIILDLSLSMNAADIKPSRLERAKLKLIDILKQRKEGQTALIAFAGDAHTVSPLTIDNKTIISLLPALEISIMPLPGSHITDALLTAKELLINAGFMQGDILLITDGLDSSHQDTITQQVKQLRQQGYQLSIIGIGSHSGSPIPIPNSGGFIKDSRGQIILSKLNSEALKTLANKGGGRYHKLSLDDSDFQALLNKKLINNQNTIEQENQIQQWVDAGAYVTLFILPLVLLIFRRGLLSLSFLFLLLPLFYNQSVQAEAQTIDQSIDQNIEQTDASGIKQKAYQFINSEQWNNLWMTRDQRGQKDFKHKNYSQAAQIFNDSRWKAGAHYRAGEFDKAIEQYEQFDDAESLYNKANSLANLQKYEQAIENYDAALEKKPDLSDAEKSRDYVKQLLEQQNQQEQQKSEQGSQGDKQQEKDKEKDDEQDSDSKNQQQQESGDENQKTDSKSHEPEEKNDPENNTSQQSSQQNNSEQDLSEQENETQNEFQQEPDETNEQQSPPSEQEAQESDTEEGENTANDVLSQLSKEEQQSLKQWLQRIPDNPGELLRIKFRNNSMIKQRQQNAPVQYKGDPW